MTCIVYVFLSYAYLWHLTRLSDSTSAWHKKFFSLNERAGNLRRTRILLSRQKSRFFFENFTVLCFSQTRPRHLARLYSLSFQRDLPGIYVVNLTLSVSRFIRGERFIHSANKISHPCPLASQHAILSARYYTRRC